MANLNGKRGQGWHIFIEQRISSG